MRWMVTAVVGTALMVYGQNAKPHNGVHAKNSTTENKDATDTFGQTVVVVNQPAPQRQENNNSSKSPGYFHELRAPANLPNLLLVVVGVVGIAVALLTLRTINNQVVEMRRQVDLTFGQLRAMYETIAEMSAQTNVLEKSVAAAEKNAAAAKDSAVALINAERPWVTATIRKTVVKGAPYKRNDLPQDLYKHDVSHFNFFLKNLGRIPAEIIAIRGDPQITDEGIDGGLSQTDEPDYGLPVVLQHAKMLAPQEEWEYDAQLTLFHYTPKQMERIRTMKDHIIFKGVVLYKDALSPDVTHETRFCYTYLQGLDDYHPSGPRQYTRYT
jgi:hypothetical protein